MWKKNINISIFYDLYKKFIHDICNNYRFRLTYEKKNINSIIFLRFSENWYEIFLHLPYLNLIKEIIQSICFFNAEIITTISSIKVKTHTLMNY